MLFPANDGVHGREMWFSDGTAAGTRMVRDFVPGATGMWDANYAFITAFGNRAYFMASDVDHGQEVWSTDGTDAGTSLVADLSPGPESSFPFAFTVTGGKLYIVGGGTMLVGPSLWVIDGTASGARAVSTAFGVSYNFGTPTVLWPVGGKVYFSGTTPLTGKEPWISDGTAAGSHLIANLAADHAPSSDPITLTAAGNLLFFNATDGTSTTGSLWRTDGTAAGTLKLSENGQYAETLQPAAGPLVFFPAQPNGQTLMMSDGTVAGTKPADDFMRRFGPKNSGRYFRSATHFSRPSLIRRVFTDSLWKTTAAPDGTAMPLGARNPFGMIDWAGRYVFYAEGPHGIYNYGLWVTDGTPAGTYAIVPDLGATNDKPGRLVNANGTLFFLNAVRDHTLMLCRSDGTTDGTVIPKELPTVSTFRTQIKAVGSNVFFFVNDGSLWFSDGTATGTTELAKVTFYSTLDNDDLRIAGNGIVYLNYPTSDTWELWGSDGTIAGTRLLKSLGSNYTTLTSIDGVVYFAGGDAPHGSEIWTTDGTVEGTKLLIDLNPGPASSTPAQFTARSGTSFTSAPTPTQPAASSGRCRSRHRLFRSPARTARKAMPQRR